MSARTPRYLWAPPPLQGFYVTFKTQRDWPPGKQRTLYFHTQFAQPGAVARRVSLGTQLPCSLPTARPCPDSRAASCRHSHPPASCTWQSLGRHAPALPPQPVFPHTPGHVPPLQMDCVPFREYNPGVLCVRLVPAPTSRWPNRAAIS